MGIYHHPSIGTFHLSEAAPRRVVPGPERHRWANKKLQRGQTTTCEKCACVRHYDHDYGTRYRMPGQQFETQERPPCTGPAAPAPPPAPSSSATTAGSAATPAPAPPPTPTMLPGLTATYDEPAPYRHHD